MCFMNCIYENHNGECTRTFRHPAYEKCPHEIDDDPEIEFPNMPDEESIPFTSNDWGE